MTHRPSTAPETHTAVQFIGIDTRYPLADGNEARRIHLDAAASPLPLAAGQRVRERFLPHYANSHSSAHLSAKISTEALHWAYQTILDFVGADPAEYAIVGMGSGATLPINRVARGLHALRPDKDIVLVSAMEHHANDLPHRQYGGQVEFIPLAGEGPTAGAVDIRACEKLLEQYRERVNYIALSAVSNVTGIVNPVRELTELAHRYDALILVDGAQQVAHLPVRLSCKKQLEEIDFYVFSGHKLYSPGAPGILIAKRDLLATLPQPDLGGGMVDEVSFEDYRIAERFPDREQAGTPNIVGLVTLAATLRCLSDIGMQAVADHDQALTAYALTALTTVPNISLYGDPDCPRVAAIAFNIQGADHGLVAALLSDYYGIAVRNECFCAHPYVRELLTRDFWNIDLEGIPPEEHEAHVNLKRGMVRASFGLYNDEADVDALVRALTEISDAHVRLREHYEPQSDGSYRHKEFRPSWTAFFDPDR